MKRLFIVIILLTCLALAGAAKRNSLAGCVFRNNDFHVVQLYFYDDKHCECTQYFNLPLPHDNGIRVDTLLYRTKGYELILKNPRILKGNSCAGEKCTDYLSLFFHPCYSVTRSWKKLKEYSFNPSRKSSLSPSSRGYWYRWPRQTIGIFELPDFLSMACYEFFLVEGATERTDVLEYTKGTWGYLWFSRERAVANTDSTRMAILGKRYVCFPDTLAFVSDSVCTIHHYSARSVRYQVDGANVLIYGWDALMPEKADTLVYQDRVLYHACVTQFSDVLRAVAPPTGIIDGVPEKYAPTAKMETRAFVLENANVTDEQIGTTFLQVFMPTNFHSFRLSNPSY